MFENLQKLVSNKIDLVHEKITYYNLAGDCNGLLGDCLGHRSNPQCFVRGSHSLLTTLVIPNKGKTLQQLSRQNSLVEIFRRDVYLEIIWSIREYLCNPQ